MSLPHRRRSIRLKPYPYQAPGAYLVTICTVDRLSLFGNVVNGKMVLSQMGYVVRRIWRHMPKHFRHISLDAFIIMPDHVHLILHIKRNVRNLGSGRGIACYAPTTPNMTDNPTVSLRRFGKMDQGSLPAIIRSFKSAVTKSIHAMGYDGVFWQRNYYESIIWTDDGLGRAREYIRLNPTKWDPNRQDY